MSCTVSLSREVYHHPLTLHAPLLCLTLLAKNASETTSAVTGEESNIVLTLSIVLTWLAKTLVDLWSWVKTMFYNKQVFLPPLKCIRPVSCPRAFAKTYQHHRVFPAMLGYIDKYMPWYQGCCSSHHSGMGLCSMAVDLRFKTNTCYFHVFILCCSNGVVVTEGCFKTT